jgi:hypothetical protein
MKINPPKNQRPDGSPDNFSIELPFDALPIERSIAALEWDRITAPWKASLEFSLEEKYAAYSRMFRAKKAVTTVLVRL